MNLQFVQVPLGRLPVHLICLSNGLVAIQPHGPFGDIFDTIYEESDSVHAHFYAEGFKMSRGLASEEYGYGDQIDYKNCPFLLKWLQQQKLENPFTPKEANEEY